MKNTLTRIIEMHPEEKFLKIDDLDDAVIGLEESTMRLIYSVELIYEELMKQGMEYEEAIEYCDFNITCAYVGDKTPIYCSTYGSLIIYNGEED